MTETQRNAGCTAVSRQGLTFRPCSRGDALHPSKHTEKRGTRLMQADKGPPFPEAPKHKQRIRHRKEDEGAVRTGKRGCPQTGSVTLAESQGPRFQLATHLILKREIKMLAKLLEETTPKATR